MIPAYIQALCQEIRFTLFSAKAQLPVHTVFFGGGTPSLVPLDGLEQILTILNGSFSLQNEAEITLEANPGTLSLAYLQGLRALGVNRLSLGMQSAIPANLQLLERQHNLEDVIQAVKWSRQAGFENINLDLIFGIPYQSIQNWEQTLRMALSLLPEHLSLYALTLEHGTPLWAWVNRGLVLTPDDDLAADMYELAGELLDKSGYTQYEISNWGKTNERGGLLSCRHNLQYWRGDPYLGYGAGAHGFANQIRTVNVLSPVKYIERLQGLKDEPILTFPSTPATLEANFIDRQHAIGEYMMMGLRLVQEGVSADEFQERFGKSLVSEFGPVIEKLTKRGLLEWNQSERLIKLTRGGRLLGNQVFLEFV